MRYLVLTVIVGLAVALVANILGEHRGPEPVVLDQHDVEHVRALVRDMHRGANIVTTASTAEAPEETGSVSVGEIVTMGPLSPELFQVVRSDLEQEYDAQTRSLERLHDADPTYAVMEASTRASFERLRALDEQRYWVVDPQYTSALRSLDWSIPTLSFDVDDIRPAPGGGYFRVVFYSESQGS